MRGQNQGNSSKLSTTNYLRFLDADTYKIVALLS